MAITMTKQQGLLGLLGICLFVVLLSVAGLASDFITHLLGNIDGLLLFAICLMMVGLFALMLLMIFKEEGWLPSHHEKTVEAATAPKTAAAKPVATVAAGAAERSQEGK
jgi:hypothetical protein